MTPPPSSRAWVGPWLAGCFLWCLIAGGVGFGMLKQHPRFLVDSDACLRLARVRELVEHRQYPFVAFPDSNVPHGETSHWGLPVDALILAGSPVFRPWCATWDEARFFAGFWLSPLLLLATLALVARSVSAIAPAPAALAACLILPLSNGAANFCYPGRPDHHALLLFLTTALVVRMGAWQRSDPHAPLPWSVPLLCAVLLWISVEAAVITALTGLFLAALTLMRGGYRDVTRFAIGLTGFSLVAAVIEHVGHLPERWSDDSLSLLHITAFAALAAGLAVVSRLPRSDRRGVRAVGLSLAGLASLAVFLALRARFNPHAHDDTWRVTMAFVARASTDGMPFWDAMEPPLAILAEGFGLPLLLAPLAAWTWWRSIALPPAFRGWILLLTVAFTALALTIARFNLYAAPLLAVLLAVLLTRLASRLPRWPALALVVLGALVLPVAGRLAADALPGERHPRRPNLAARLETLRGAWESDRLLTSRSAERRVYTHLCLGPELMYRWRARISGTPDIRNAAAVSETLRRFASVPADTALAELRADGWPYLLIYADPSLQEVRIWRQVAPSSTPPESTLFGVLSRRDTTPLPAGVSLLAEQEADPARGCWLRLFRLDPLPQ